MRATLITAAALALAPLAGHGQQLGDHPAIVVQRLHAQAGYDYASKFYPHPAWLYLFPQAPDELALARARSERLALAERADAERRAAAMQAAAPPARAGR